ncbi:hypothetical protein [Microvirga arabica]|uniref:hypothetical protein n=1 Tax=Microvirga arabica TaxID=1128671 RepID=UPI0019398065|nr:hypothetical protein [Microvirga arabica]MBM1174387.1 hypothetical protein [Microvirga arabica]
MDQVTVHLRTTQDPPASSPTLKARRGEGASEGKPSPIQDPFGLVAHPVLDPSAKRAILASWASDACAVESLPNWRKLPETGALVPLDDILDALRALDSDALH